MKAGKIDVVESAMPALKAANEQMSLIPEGSTLVPVPRSSPLPPDALWPSKIIADVLFRHGMGSQVVPCIERTVALRKSSTSASRDRPNVAAHYDSFTVNNDLLVTDKIVLVDDVLTLGRTVFACAIRLQEAFPQATISAFAIFRTQGLKPEIEVFVDPAKGTVTCTNMHGYVTREP